MLENNFVEGTGLSEPNAMIHDYPVGPRFYYTTVRQGPLARENNFKSAYVFVGVPIDETELAQIKSVRILSDNQGVVLIQSFIMGGFRRFAHESRAVIPGFGEDIYGILGFLPSPELKKEMQLRGYLLEREGIVYCSPEDFPGLVVPRIDIY